MKNICSWVNWEILYGECGHDASIHGLHPKIEKKDEKEMLLLIWGIFVNVKIVILVEKKKPVKCSDEGDESNRTKHTHAHRQIDNNESNPSFLGRKTRYILFFACFISNDFLSMKILKGEKIGCQRTLVFWSTILCCFHLSFVFVSSFGVWFLAMVQIDQS